MPHVSPSLKNLISSELSLMEFFSENPRVNTYSLSDNSFSHLTSDMKRLAVLFSSVSLRDRILESSSTAPSWLRSFAEKLNENGFYSTVNALSLTSDFDEVAKRVNQLASDLEGQKLFRKTKPFFFSSETMEVLAGGIFIIYEQSPIVTRGLLNKITSPSGLSRSDPHEMSLEIRQDEALLLANALEAMLDYEFDEELVGVVERLEIQAVKDIENLRNLFE